MLGVASSLRRVKSKAPALQSKAGAFILSATQAEPTPSASNVGATLVVALSIAVELPIVVFVCVIGVVLGIVLGDHECRPYGFTIPNS